MNLGFIGLGHLGRAIAERLISCGHTLTVWNRTSSKSKGLRATLASSPKLVAEKADIIMICLFDSKAVRSVLTREDGLLSSVGSKKIIIDLTTNHFKDAEDFHKLCKNKQMVYLEAPVLGSVVPASQGTLSILISGDQSGYETARPLLECLGKHIFYLESPALATKMKLINNLVLGNFMVAIAEALSIGETVGVEKSDILDILSVGAGNSLVLNAKKEKLLKEDFSTHFSNALIYKDLHCLQDLVYENKNALFTGSLIKELYARTFQMGISQEDFSAIYKIFKP